MSSVSLERKVNRVGQSAIVNVAHADSSGGFRTRAGVAHRHAQADGCQQLDVIVPIADHHRFCQGHAVMRRQHSRTLEFARAKLSHAGEDRVGHIGCAG